MENATERNAKSVDPTFGHNFLTEFLRKFETWATKWGQPVAGASFVQYPPTPHRVEAPDPRNGCQNSVFSQRNVGSKLDPKFKATSCRWPGHLYLCVQRLAAQHTSCLSAFGRVVVSQDYASGDPGSNAPPDPPLSGFALGSRSF